MIKFSCLFFPVKDHDFFHCCFLLGQKNKRNLEIFFFHSRIWDVHLNVLNSKILDFHVKISYLRIWDWDHALRCSFQFFQPKDLRSSSHLLPLKDLRLRSEIFSLKDLRYSSRNFPFKDLSLRSPMDMSLSANINKTWQKNRLPNQYWKWIRKSARQQFFLNMWFCTFYWKKQFKKKNTKSISICKYRFLWYPG